MSSIFKEFLRSPLRTGAIAASSRRLASEMVAQSKLERADYVVELGAGTGSFTEEILRKLRPTANFLALELNPVLADQLADKFAGRPVRIVEDSAERIVEIVDRPVDVIVSGLPWSVLPAASRHRILDGVKEVLAADGTFATFAYVHMAKTPSARQFHGELSERFGVTTRSEAVWANLPPAYVYRAAHRQPAPQQIPIRESVGNKPAPGSL